MDAILILQIIFIFLMFVLNLLCALLPLKIIPKDPEKLLSRRSQRILSLCSCLSGGVFLGTCYLQLIPYLQKKFTQVFRLSNADENYSELTTQCTIMAGFFLILLVEQGIQVWQESRDSQKSASKRYALVENQFPVSGSNTELIELPDGGYMASSDCSLSEESDADERRHMIKKTNPKSSRYLVADGTSVKSSPATTVIIPSQSSTKPPANHNSSSASFTTIGVNSLISTVDSASSNISSGNEQKSVKFNRPQSGHTSGQGQGQGHGHSHAAHGHSHITDIVTANHGLLRSFLLLAALSVHSLFEGMAVGLQETIMSLVNLFIGVLLHECLIAFSIGISLTQQQNQIKRGTILKLCVVFSLMIPVGMAIGLIIGGLHGFLAELTSALIQGIAAGTFVYVIFFEILPAEINSNSSEDRLWKVFFIFVGFGIILCLQLSLNEHGD